MEERRGETQVELWECRVGSYKSSPVQLLLEHVEVKSGRQRKTEEKIDSNKERKTRTDVDTS